MARPDAARDDQFFTLMLMTGQAGAIRRFSVRKTWLNRSIWAAALLGLVFAGFSLDYVVARRQLVELDRLRAEASEQREQIATYVSHVQEISDKLSRVDALERKLRVITNLDPADPLPLPGIGGSEGDLLGTPETAWLSRARRHRQLRRSFGHLSGAAGAQTESLEALLAHLEENTARLLATPSITPTRGWITSTFGHRTSPFTGNREFHRGLDIAGRQGTAVVAPADGVVRFAGKKRALGNAVVMRHGYGIETRYGHLKEVLVKKGAKVKRGQKIALMGNTGRSTGPHLHYQVEVNGKPVNPKNYMLD